jgi:hypothetical protein
VALVSRLQMILIIPKLIETALFAINIFLINKKNKHINWKDRPQFHRSFLMGMMAWTIYILLDIFIYTCAGLSMDDTTPFGTYQGYDPNYPSLNGVNILRDIAFGASAIMSWNYLIAAFALRYDEENIEAVFTKNFITIFLMAMITLIITVGDVVQVTVSESGISVGGIFNGFAGLSIALNVIIYIICALLLYITLREVSREDPSKDFKKRIRFFMWGIIFMGIGHIYWVIIGLIQSLNPSILALPEMLYFFLGHSFWIISPVLIYFGFGKGKKTANEEDLEKEEIGKKTES